MARAYAPALTRQAFKQLRPQGDYQKYVSYLTQHRPGWKPEAYTRPQRVPPPMRGPSYTQDLLLRRLQILNPQQMEAQANRMAGTQLKAQQALLQQDYADRQKEAMNRMRAFQVAGNQAAAMNASLIGQVGSQYQAGADQLNAMAAGGASMMAGATASDVAAANNALGNVGAPAVSIGGPVGAPGIAGDVQAGVESYRGGTLPANAMQSAGGYQQAGMAGQISSQNLRATQEAEAAYMQAMAKANDDRSSAMKAMAVGRPDIAMKYLSQLQDNQRQAIALASSMVGTQFEQGMKTKAFNQSAQAQAAQLGQVDPEKSMALGYVVDARGKRIPGAKLEKLPDYQKMQAAIAASNADANLVDYSTSRAWGYLVNKQGQFIINPKTGKPQPIASTSTAGGGKKGGLTPYQISRLMPKAQDAAEGFYYGYGFDARGKRIPISQLPGFDPSSATPGQGTLNYSQAKTRLGRMGVPAGAAQGILNELYGRGESQRPLLSSREQALVKRNYGAKGVQKWAALIKAAVTAGDYQMADNLAAAAIQGGVKIPDLPTRTASASSRPQAQGGVPWWQRGLNAVTTAGGGSFGQLGR